MSPVSGPRSAARVVQSCAPKDVFRSRIWAKLGTATSLGTLSSRTSMPEAPIFAHTRAVSADFAETFRTTLAPDVLSVPPSPSPYGQ